MAAFQDEEDRCAGLCARCFHVRRHRTRHSLFYRCALAESDARFHKYPPLPVSSCPGFEAELEASMSDDRVAVLWHGDPQSSTSRSRPVFVDFTRIDVTSRGGRDRRQPIARAVGIKRGKPVPTVVDATAGYGEDSWLLASLGCRVVAIERHPLVAALLEDGLRRARQQAAEIADRISLVSGEATEVLAGIRPPPEVIYLDPMFPPRRGSALEAKAMRLLRRLVGDDDDAARLLDRALETATRRVVVKRPLRADPLRGTPTAAHRGKSLRYDVYVL